MANGFEGSPVFDWTSLDFAGIEKDLITYAQSRYGNEVWTDLNESNEGRRLIELMAYATDLLSYTENAHALETIIASVIREQNFRNIAKAFDFTLKSASPSKTILQFEIDPDYLPLDIDSSIKVADGKSGQVIFQPDVSGTATTTTYVVNATQGDEVEEELGAATGQPGQSYQLAQSPVIDGTLSIFVGGTRYVIIPNMIEAGPLDTVCLIETNEALETTVRFGDGLNGRIPALGATITAYYKIGGGSNVNFPKDTITRVITAVPGILGVTNITAAEGGGPRQSLLMAKRLLPLSIKANERCVTLQDYETAAMQLVPGVLKARAVQGLFQAGGNPVLLFVVPNGGGDVPSGLKNQIVTTLRYGANPRDQGRSMAGRRIFVYPPVYVDLMITADAFVNKGSQASLVGERVRKAFMGRYSLEATDFGTEVDLQDAYNTVDPNERRIDGLNRVYLRQFTVKPYSGRYVTKPSTGDGEAIGISTNANTQRREWGIKVIPGKRFYVYQRQLGNISSIGDHALEDEQSSYDTDSLVTSKSGYRLRVREQEQSETFTIVANRGGSITVSGVSSPGKVSSLLVLATDKDTYAVERQESTIGKILKVVTGDEGAEGDTSLVNFSSTAGLVAGDWVIIEMGTSVYHITRLTAVTPTSITFADPLPQALSGFAHLYSYWWSDDRTCGFALVEGSTPFSNGDELYVDTFAQAGDIRLRPENYPVLNADNLRVNPVGGVK